MGKICYFSIVFFNFSIVLNQIFFFFLNIIVLIVNSETDLGYKPKVENREGQTLDGGHKGWEIWNQKGTG